MKKTLFAVAIALVVLGAMASVVLADNGPHGSFTATTDACASCHRLHSATYGSNSLLLASPEEICLECHDGRGAGTNVLMGVWNQGAGGNSATDSSYGGSDSYYGTTYTQGTDGGSLLGGGFLYARMSTSWNGANFFDTTGATSPASAATTSHHNYNGDLGTIWGSGANNSGAGIQYGLECISCHSPHGNAGYIQSTKAYPTTYLAVDDQTPDNTAAASYRLLRWQPEGSGGFTAPTDTVNWSGGAFKSNGASTPVTGWLIPDNYRTNNHDEWYTIETKTDVGTQGVGFAKSDYAAGNGANVYQIVDGWTVKRDYTAAAVNLAFFCAQCHDRYFTNSKLRNATDDSVYCGSPIAGKFAGTVLLAVVTPDPVTGLHPTDSARCEPVYNATTGILTGWGDNGSSGDTTYAFKHASGDIRLSMDGTVAQGTGTSLSRSCMACHVSHGTTAQMTTFASNASLAGDSALLRLDNRSMCLRCHGSSIGFVVTPNAAATATQADVYLTLTAAGPVGNTSTPTTVANLWVTQTAAAYATSLGAVPSATPNGVWGPTATAARGTATAVYKATMTGVANATNTAIAAATQTAAANKTATANAIATSVCATNTAAGTPTPCP